MPDAKSFVSGRGESRSVCIIPYVILLQLLVIAAYIWYFTTGLWVRMPSTFTTDLYDQLSTAFLKGHLYLERQPASDLLALRDPYAIQQRKNVSSYIGDATLYNGRYYLYWGPVPALLLSTVRYVGYTGRIGDESLVVIFIAGIFVCMSTTMTCLWRLHFRHLPRWTLLGAIPIMGTVTPFLWVLNHPLIYEAAVASAEFFFLGGVCWAYLALRQRRLPALFLLPAALFWALALGCQFTQVFAVAAALIVTTAWAWRRIDIRQRLWSALRLFGCLWLPALLVLVGLAWYNRERFGSVLEFGYRYQLAVVNLHEHYREIFSPGYVIANLYNYLLNPFQVSRDFPFLHPQFGTVLAGFPLHVPRIYYTEAITGLLYTAPFVMFAIIPAWLEVKGLRRGAMRAWFAEWTDERLHWLVMTLTVAVAVEMAVLLFFYYSAPRYLTAVIPPLLPVAVFGFWQGFHALSTKPRALKYYCLAAIVLACCSILVSSLLAISSSQDRFLEGNPVLMQQIGAFFSH